MSNKTFENNSLSDNDVQTILFALSVLPTLNLESSEAQSKINLDLCVSAAEKLANADNDFLPNEIRVISGALTACKYILSGDLTSCQDVLIECRKYTFSINKLEPVFFDMLSDMRA